MRNIQRGPIVELVTQVCLSFLYLKPRVRRRDVTSFICGSGAEHSKERSRLRRVVTNCFDDLVAQSYAAPGRITKVSDAPTGSGEIKFWTLSGRPPKWSKIQRVQELQKLEQLKLDSQPVLMKFLKLGK